MDLWWVSPGCQLDTFTALLSRKGEQGKMKKISRVKVRTSVSKKKNYLPAFFPGSASLPGFLPPAPPEELSAALRIPRTPGSDGAGHISQRSAGDPAPADRNVH